MVNLYNLSQHAPSPCAELEVEDDEKLRLYLPSNLRSQDLVSLTASEITYCRILVSSEASLRLAVLTDCLDAIKRILRTKLSTKSFQSRNLRGQKANTRARAVLAQIDSKLSEQKKRYRRNRQALLNLDPNGDWKHNFLPLTDQDTRLPLRKDDDDYDLSSEDEPESSLRQRDQQKTGTGQGYRTESWIWEKAEAMNSDDAGDGELLRSFTLAGSLSTTKIFFAPFGCRLKPVLIAGVKKLYSYWKKCVVRLLIVSGNKTGGYNEYLFVQLQFFSVMACPHMPVNNPMSGKVSACLSPPSGALFLRNTIYPRIGHIRSPFRRLKIMGAYMHLTAIGYLAWYALCICMRTMH